MHLFSTAFLARHQFKLLFVVIWLHVSVLDLFYITYNGLVLLWHNDTQLPALVVHFLIVHTSTILFKIFAKTQINKPQEDKPEKLGKQSP